MLCKAYLENSSSRTAIIQAKQITHRIDYGSNSSASIAYKNQTDSTPGSLAYPPMDFLNHKSCEKHKLQAKLMCTKEQCFDQANILVCKECFPQHSDHAARLIEVSLLNEKVHELMKKRMEFEKYYQQSCDAMVTELKKFKMFKEQIVNALNYRERCLNELCKKIRKNIPYEKDKHLFKNHLGYAFLAMKGINPNIDLYRNFRHNLFESLNDCRNALHRFELNMAEVPMLLVKEHQICSILKQVGESVPAVEYFDPCFSRFKKETIKINAPNVIYDWRLHRVSGEQFIAYSKETKFIKWYNTHSFHFPKILPVGSTIQHLQVLNKNAYITDEAGRIIIYDLLNEKVLKEYASTNHKNASITNLLALSPSHILNFITSPNQIVCLHFDEENETLKMTKGVETKSKSLASVLFDDQFVSIFDDKTAKLYHTDELEWESQLEFDHSVRAIAKINHSSYVIGGESEYLTLADIRVKGSVARIDTDEYCTEVKKIYPMSVMTINGKSLKIFDIRMQKELFSSRSEEPLKHLEVLNSGMFVTSGKHLTFWRGIQ